MPEELALGYAEILPNGRLGALLYSNGGTLYVTFVPAGDGTWLLDVVDLEAGTIAPIPVRSGATPAG